MDFITTLLIFLGAIVIHEIVHFIIGWYFSKNIPEVRFKKLGIMIKTNLYNKKQKQLFLGYAIISGMIFISLFMFKYNTEAWIALIAYLCSCWYDFKSLMLLEVKND